MPSKINDPNQPAYLSNDTFLKEAELPHLPVPSLSETLKQLEISLVPLLDDEESKSLQSKINEFKQNPVSKTLQNHLLKFYQNEDCYLDHLNLDHILIDHKALPRNPFLILENDPLKQIKWDQSQADRAAVLTTSALKFISSLRLGTLTQDTTMSGNPLTMKPYLNLFGTTRLPEFDSIRSKTNLTSDYILILSKSQFYTLKVITDQNEIIFTSDELREILQDILKEIESVENPNSTAIGSITSDTYKNWKSSRIYLQREFPENLNLVDSALFVLVLDHSTPDDQKVEELAKTISVGSLNIDEYGVQTGSCTSRWYDKLQLVVTANSVAGVIWDSFTADGTSVLRFTSDIFTDSVLRLGDGNYTLFPGVMFLKKGESVKPKPQKLEWNFAADAQTSLHLAETRLTDLICTHLTNTKTLKFGRNFAKKIGVKADSLIQISLQIAHYALYGQPISTVEPVSTRFFKNSRSELYPVQNNFITKTCQIFVSDSAPETRWQAFIDCCNFHTQQLKKSAKGEGFEKHLKALQNVYLQREIFNNVTPEFDIPDKIPPLLFDDVIFPLFVPDLVASNCGNPAMRLFGLTPAVSNGFGIGYIIKDDFTEICLISQYRQNERFLSTLDWVFHQLQHIWKHDVGVKKIPHAHELDNNLRSSQEGRPKSNLQPVSMSRSTTAGTSSEEEIDVALGGYGYFDIDDLTLRSNVQTPTLSHQNSSTNLTKFKINQSDFDKNFGKRIHNERLKEFFEKHESDSSDQSHRNSNTSSDSGNTSGSNKSFDSKFDRGQVGKKVSVDEVL